MKPITVLAVREQVSDALRKAIFNGELNKGEELTQDQIATKLGVSRMPVREAFQALERDGLLILNNHRKAVVRGLTTEDILDHYDIRALLEGEAAVRSCYSDEMDEMIACQAQVEKAACDGDAAFYVQANAAFHHAIWEASGSHRLVLMLEQLWSGLPPHLPELVSTQIEYSVQEHRDILSAIQNGQREDARKFTEAHIRRSMNDFLTSFDARNVSHRGGV